MQYTTFDLAISEHIAFVTLNRPEQRNTMTLKFWPELRQVFTELTEHPEVRAVVFASTGKHFTAGLDLRDFAVLGAELTTGDRGRSSERFRRLCLSMQESFTAIERCRVPVLSAIQGGCIGGGVDLISACDMRYCTSDAFFSIHEINIGMTADVGTLQRLPHLIPQGMVRELAYTGRRLLAGRALELGLVNAVYPSHEAMLAEVTTVAREIAQRSPLAILGTKEMLNYTRDHSVADSLNYVATWNAGMFFTSDVAEQMAANLEKRPAQFAELLPPRKLTD
ncbi:MAG TPA: crotonase/enoyl-CoA hydratase family protein [Pseudomonadota bacterium]|nr:crotonase/enoyl-CoA hydratase family protein [Pseudomonadota bacterium]